MAAASAASEEGHWSPKAIVVGYDGTRPAEHALARALELARTFGARLVIADVAAPQALQTTPGAYGFMPYPYELENGALIEETLWQQHRSHLAELLAQTGVPHEFAQVVGEPVTEIVEVAEQRNADLIVVGTREPSFFERLLGGSVSQGVARHAHRDVLIVHPEHE